MKRQVAAGVLGLVVAVGVEAQPLDAPGALARGRELTIQGDLLGVADAFHAALRGGPAGRHTVRVGVFCDIANLERQVRASGNAPELFVLRRSVGGRPWLALFLGALPFAGRGAGGDRDDPRPAARLGPGVRPRLGGPAARRAAHRRGRSRAAGRRPRREPGSARRGRCRRAGAGA